MKYKSISLNGTDNYQYSLVKYEDKYKDILGSMKEIDVNLIDSVITCPRIYSVDSDHQAYMLVKDDDIGVGATYIGTSTDEKDLEVSVNQFLSELNGEVLDMKFQVAVAVSGEDQIYCFSVLILYQ